MFITVDKNQIVENSLYNSGIGISPIDPANINYGERIVWWDLHLSATAFRGPGRVSDNPWKEFFTTRKKLNAFITIEPNQTLIVQTIEEIRTSKKRVGIILGSASITVSGLLITSGKIDPEYGPEPVALSIQNVSNRVIYLNEGDKIATVAFAAIDRVIDGRKPTGHASPENANDPRFISRLISFSASLYRKYRNLSIGTVLFYFFVIYTDSIVLGYVDNATILGQNLINSIKLLSSSP